MISDDMALVREFAQSNSEQAFATLVSRHVNLVYSVALRQVRNPHLAEEVTQSVFIILAEKAKSLSPKTILSGWLCRTARYVSANTLSIQRRRQFREQKAHMESILHEPEPGVWNQIAPLLEEALNCLGEKEHDAVVLRFFDGKELKQVGASMATTEDAARMRVNRGLEKLREFFTKKGVTLSATAIAGAVAANSVQAAPAGLAATITAAALSGTTITTAAVIAATKGMAMATLQKTVIAAAFAVAVGAGIYEARQAANARAEVQTLRQQQAPLAEQIQQLQRERGDTTNQLAVMAGELAKNDNNNLELLKLRAEVSRLRNQVQTSKQGTPTGDSADEGARSIVSRVNQLKQYLERNPNEKIPELQFLSDNNWLSASSNAGLETKNFETEGDYEHAVERLRGDAESRFAKIVQEVMRKYSAAKNGENPPDLSQLQQYCEPSVGDIIQQLYEIKPKSALPEDLLKNLTVKAEWFITRKQGGNPSSSFRLAIFPYNTFLWQ